MKNFARITALCLLPVGAIAQDQSEEDKGYIASLIEDNLSGDTRTVTLSGFAGALSSQATIVQLTVADSDGVWLTLEDVTMTWNRTALLRGAIDIEELTASKITVARAPLSDDSLPVAEATPFALPELPVSIALGNLQVDRIDLGPDFLGDPLSFSLAGAASLSGGEGDVDIEAQRLDGPTGRFLIDGAYANATSVLDIALELVEGPDGIVANLAGIPDRPSVALNLTGNAPLDDFAANLRLSTDNVERVSGDFTLTRTAEQSRFSVDIGGDIAPLLAPDYRDFFGNRVSLVASGNQTDAGFDLDALTLGTDLLQLSGAAKVDADGWPERLALTGQIADDSGDIVLLPLSGPKTFVNRVDLDIAYDRAVSDDWTATFDINGLDRPGVFIDEITLDGGGIIAPGEGSSVGLITAQMTYAATGLELDDSGAANAFGDTIAGVFDLRHDAGQPTKINQLTLTGPGIDLVADATIDGADNGFETQANVILSADALARFATLAGQPALSGAADLTLIAGTRPLDGTFDLLLTGQTTDLTSGIAQLDPLLTGTGDLSLQAVRDTAGTRLEALRIMTSEAVVTANADLTSTGSNATFDIEVNDVGLVLDGLTGPATLTGKADRTAAGMTTFDVVGSGPAAQIAAKGTVQEAAEGATVNADVTAAVTDLSRYETIAGRPLGGAIDLTASGVLLSDGARFDADLNARTRDLRTGIAQLDPLLAGSGTLAVAAARTGSDAFRLDALTIKTAAVDLAANGEGSVTGPVQATLALTLTDAGQALDGLNGPLQISLDGRRDDSGKSAVTLNANGTGTTIDLDATIAAPQDDYRIAGTLNANVADLRPFRDLIGQPVSGGITAKVTGGGLPDMSALDATIAVRTNDVGIGNASADRLLAGVGQFDAEVSRNGETINVPAFSAQTNALTVNGGLETDGTTGRATFASRLANIGMFTDQLSGPVTADGSATLNANSSWGIDLDAAGPGGIGAQVNGTATPGGNLNLSVNGSAPLGLANTVLDPRRISGIADIGLNINGPAALSSVSGQITTNGARLAAPSLGQALSDIRGGVTLNGGSAAIDVTAAVQSGGQLRVSGPVALSAPFNGDISVALDQVILRDPNLYDSSVNGAITVSGPLAGGARIAGNLTLGQTDIQVPSSGIGALGDLPDVVHVGANGQVLRTLDRAGVNDTPESVTTRSGPVFPLDLTVNAPSRIFIRGRGVDAELGGALSIGGTSANVIPTGQFDLIRGRINILQQRFDLNEGSATLQGGFIPYIRLVATTEAATGTVIQIIVEGPADAPEVTFEATPELPQDEVLSQLIFGRNLADISPLQAVQLASAVGTLAGRGGGGLIDNFRQGIGLDDFDVTTDDDGNAAVRAGAYLSENVYTDVTINSEGDTEINLNLDITNDIRAKGTVDADGETSIGIFFERDY